MVSKNQALNLICPETNCTNKVHLFLFEALNPSFPKKLNAWGHRSINKDLFNADFSNLIRSCYVLDYRFRLDLEVKHFLGIAFTCQI